MIEGIAAAAKEIGAAVAETAKKAAEATAEAAKNLVATEGIDTIAIKVNETPASNSLETLNMEIVKNRSLESIQMETGDVLPGGIEDVLVEYPVGDIPQMPPLEKVEIYSPEKAPIDMPIGEIPKLPSSVLIEQPFPDGGKLLDYSRDSLEKLSENGGNPLEATVKEVEERTELTDEEKALIRDEMGWSDEIIYHIENMDQYEIYKNAGLHEAEIDGRKCLVKDIDMDYYDENTQMTNRERMERGLAPIDAKTGEPIELHHMGQGYDAPFAELAKYSEHMSSENNLILHPVRDSSWRTDAVRENRYNNYERPNHWKERAKEG